jgi:flagellar protein FlgJ
MTNRIADANNFLDINGLNSIRLQSKTNNKEDKEQALEAAAKQFEGIFMQMVLKSMRKAEDVLASDSPFNTETTKFYREMHDQQLAVELSNSGSLGLAPLIVRQLGGDRKEFTPHSVLRADGNLPNDTALESNSNTHELTQLNFSKAQQETGNNTQKNANDEQNSQAADAVNTSFPLSLTTPTFSEPKDFVTALTEPAKQVEQQLGVPFQVVIAQAALETGWGQKIIKTANGNSSNNLFNIKADTRWQGDSTQKETLEFEQGAMVKKSAPFRVYDSIKESINDYINFLSSSERYQDALQHNGNVEHFLQGLSKAGYATDPDYANKILGTLSKVTRLLNK